jgi:hypothetical protein
MAVLNMNQDNIYESRYRISVTVPITNRYDNIITKIFEKKQNFIYLYLLLKSHEQIEKEILS